MRSIVLALTALTVTFAAPAVAQNAMSSPSKMGTHDQMSSDAMKMSAADTRKMKSCNAMSREAMMKDAGCAKLMKAHPDMMKNDSMMKQDGMMKSGR